MFPSYRTGLRSLAVEPTPKLLVHGCKSGTLGWQPLESVTLQRKSSRERPALRRVGDRAGGDRRRGCRRPVAPGRLRARPRQRRARRGCGRVARHRAAAAVEPRLRPRHPRQRRLALRRRRRRHAARHPRRARAARRPVPARRRRPGCPPHKPDPAASRRRRTSSSRSASSCISCWRPGATAEPASCRRGSGPACCWASGARCWRRSRRSPVSPPGQRVSTLVCRRARCWAYCRSRSRRWRSHSTCTGGCATCSFQRAPSAARTSPSSSPRCSTARRR